MNLDIKLHHKDLPAEIKFSDKIAIDCEFTGLNIERDRLCLVQISSGNNDAHIIQLDKENYDAPNLKKILQDNNINKIFHFARADLLFIKKLNYENQINQKIINLVSFYTWLTFRTYVKKTLQGLATSKRTFILPRNA